MRLIKMSILTSTGRDVRTRAKQLEAAKYRSIRDGGLSYLYRRPTYNV